MDIFENLENLNVSEECFDEIMDIVETLVGKWKEKGFPANKGAKDEMIVNLHPRAIEKENKKAEVASKELNDLRAKAKEGKADSTDLFSKNFEKEAAKNKAYWLKKDMDDAQKRLDTQNKYRREALMNVRMKKENK